MARTRTGTRYAPWTERTHGTTSAGRYKSRSAACCSTRYWPCTRLRTASRPSDCTRGTQTTPTPNTSRHRSSCSWPTPDRCKCRTDTGCTPAPRSSTSRKDRKRKIPPCFQRRSQQDTPYIRRSPPCCTSRRRTPRMSHRLLSQRRVSKYLPGTACSWPGRSQARSCPARTGCTRWIHSRS